MIFKRFSLLLSVRYVALLAILIVCAWCFQLKGYHTVTLILCVLFVTLAAETFRFINKTNTELNRFMDAINHADFSQKFSYPNSGTGFDELGQKFQTALDRLQQQRSKKEAELRHIKSLIEHVPVPLLSIYSTGRIHLWNSSARKLMGVKACTQLDDFQQFGAEFHRGMSTIAAGKLQLLNFHSDDQNYTLMATASEFIAEGNRETLVSLQNIQSELDAAQLQAWQDLVRVLTHEIMNSITPIASLAKTAEQLIDGLPDQNDANAPAALSEELEDIGHAIRTVARRSDNLTQFVQSYRTLTRLPKPNKTHFRINDLFEDAATVATQGWQAKALTLTRNIEPSNLELYADKGMLEQVIINLLKNAEQALGHNGSIQLGARLNTRGNVVLTIEDNGPGIAEDIIESIFVPFFTTKKEGTGVGLALTRQVLIRHGGTIKAENIQPSGARFSLTF